MKSCSKCGKEQPISAYYKQSDCKDGLRPNCRTCISQARAAHRAANLSKIQEYERHRYATQPGRAAANKAAAKRSYSRDRDAALAYRREHYRANRETYLAYSAKRKATKRSVEHQPYTRREIYDRDSGHCMLCGCDLIYEPNGFHIDHIVPLALGGPDIPANLQLACQTCNRTKHANLEGQIRMPV